MKKKTQPVTIQKFYMCFLLSRLKFHYCCRSHQQLSGVDYVKKYINFIINVCKQVMK